MCSIYTPRHNAPAGETSRWPWIQWKECQTLIKERCFSLLLFTEVAKCWNTKSSGNRCTVWFTSRLVKYEQVHEPVGVFFLGNLALHWQDNYNHRSVLITNWDKLAERKQATALNYTAALFPQWTDCNNISSKADCFTISQQEKGSSCWIFIHFAILEDTWLRSHGTCLTFSAHKNVSQLSWHPWATRDRKSDILAKAEFISAPMK